MEAGDYFRKAVEDIVETIRNHVEQAVDEYLKSKEKEN